MKTGFFGKKAEPSLPSINSSVSDPYCIKIKTSNVASPSEKRVSILNKFKNMPLP